MASNTSSISITKIGAATVPEGVSAGSEKGRKFAERVIGRLSPGSKLVGSTVHSSPLGLHFFNPVPIMVWPHRFLYFN